MNQSARPIERSILTDNRESFSASYQTGGAVTQVSATEERLVHSIDGFMGSSRLADGQGNHHISFRLATADRPVWAYTRPAEAGLLYACPFFKCWDLGHRRWLEVPGKALVCADLNDNIAFASIRSAPADSAWIIAHYVFYPLWTQMLKKTELYHLHAGCVGLDGKGLLLPGPSGCGKSTLSLNLVHHGFEFVSDDTVFLRSSGNRVIAEGFAENVKVSRETAALFSELAAVRNQAPDPARQKLEFDVAGVFDASIKGSAVPTAIIFPRFTRGGKTIIKPVTRAEALTLLFDYSMFMADPASSARHFEMLTGLVDKAACYEAEIGADNRASALMIRKVLEEVPA